jgi:hypothetical protein
MRAYAGLLRLAISGLSNFSELRRSFIVNDIDAGFLLKLRNIMHRCYVNGEVS